MIPSPASLLGWIQRAQLVRSDVTLGTLAERLATVHGDRRLFTEPSEGGVVSDDGGHEHTLTYREASDLVARWAGTVASRTKPGDRVVLAMPNGYPLLLACQAVARAGAIAVPVNARMRPAEIDHVVTDSGAGLVVRDGSELDGAEPLHHAVERSPSDVAAVFYTSGTTGTPKGAQLTSAGLLSQLGPAALWPSGLRRDEIVAGLPVSHIMGFSVLLAAAFAGIPVYFLPRFRPDDALDAIESRRATVFVGVPAMYRLMLEAGAEERDLRSIRLWVSGADVLPDDISRRFQRMGAAVTLPVVGLNVGGAAFVEGYGMVELSGGVAARVSPAGFPLPMGTFLGVPLPPNRFRVVGHDDRDVAPGQVGELLVKGPGVLAGYHDDPEATAKVVTEDGWLRTGDLARRGPFGLVFFEGREKDVIKHGGYSVYAVEVERVLDQHPDVAESAVLGLPDERKGAVPVAAVRLNARAGTVTTSEDELRAWATERLSDYKVPVRIVFVDDLPRTGTAKVKKDQLVELFGNGRRKSTTTTPDSSTSTA